MSLDMAGIIVPYAGMTRDDLIRKIEEHAAARGIAPATVTSRGVGNSRLYRTLKAGGGCTLEIAERLIIYMDQNRTVSPSQQDVA